MKRIFCLKVLFATVFATSAFALTAEEILLLKKAGVPDEKILEMQKKDGTAPLSLINIFGWDEDGQ